MPYLVWLGDVSLFSSLSCLQPERMEEDFSYHIRTDLTGSVSHSNIMTVSLAPSYLLETGISWCSTAYSAFPGTGIDR